MRRRWRRLEVRHLAALTAVGIAVVVLGVLNPGNPVAQYLDEIFVHSGTGFADLATTGDGVLTGLQVLDVMVRAGRPLAELAAVMDRLPQVLRNVPVASRAPTAQGSEDLALAIKAVEEELGDRGRVLVRPSGTEPVVRVMVEAMTHEEAEAACEALCRAVLQSLGSQTPG